MVAVTRGSKDSGKGFCRGVEDRGREERGYRGTGNNGLRQTHIRRPFQSGFGAGRANSKLEGGNVSRGH